MENLDWFDPDMVRLATYLASAGKTWKDPATGKLKTEINGKFIPVVRDLMLLFFPPTVYRIGGNQVITEPGMSVVKHYLSITNLDTNGNSLDLLENFEKHGYNLGSGRRKPNTEVINSPHLFKAYLRVLWEVHGKITSTEPLKIAIEQKYPQELSSLKSLFMMINIYAEIKRDNFYYLEISDEVSIKNFFDLFDWTGDWKYGEKKINEIKRILNMV
jgi:hypothetical protein